MVKDNRILKADGWSTINFLSPRGGGGTCDGVKRGFLRGKGEIAIHWEGRKISGPAAEQSRDVNRAKKGGKKGKRLVEEIAHMMGGGGRRKKPSQGKV